MRGASRNPLRTPGPAPPEAHKSLISRKTGAEVPLTGLSLGVAGFPPHARSGNFQIGPDRPSKTRFSRAEGGGDVQRFERFAQLSDS